MNVANLVARFAEWVSNLEFAQVVCQLGGQISTMSSHFDFAKWVCKIELPDLRVEFSQVILQIDFAIWIARCPGWFFKKKWVCNISLQIEWPDFPNEFSNLILPSDFAHWVTICPNWVFNFCFATWFCNVSCQGSSMRFHHLRLQSVFWKLRCKISRMSFQRLCGNTILQIELQFVCALHFQHCVCDMMSHIELRHLVTAFSHMCLQDGFAIWFARFPRWFFKSEFAKWFCKFGLPKVRAEFSTVGLHHDVANGGCQISRIVFNFDCANWCCRLSCQIPGMSFRASVGKLSLQHHLPDPQHEFSNVILQHDFANWVTRFPALVFKHEFAKCCLQF